MIKQEIAVVLPLKPSVSCRTCINKMAAPTYLSKEYLDARPTYPPSLFSTLASLTPNHSLAWDVGAGNGQASVAIAEHYERVIATDISKQQLEVAQKHPGVTYALRPLLTDEVVQSVVGAEGSVDLVTAGTAVHWFDLETFYSQVKRLLRKPGGVIAVWTYTTPTVSPAVDAVLKEFMESSMAYRNPKGRYAFERYKTLPFPFHPVLPGGGGEGNPVVTVMEKDVSLEGYLGLLKSWSATAKAREEGVELLNENILRAFRQAWYDDNKIRTCKFELYMLAGTLPL